MEKFKNVTVTAMTPFPQEDNNSKKTLDDIVKSYKPYEVDFIIPDSSADVRVYLDLYLMYESKDLEWHEVQALIFEYFNRLLIAYRSKKISEQELLENLYFPEVEAIGFGHCKKGVSGRGTHSERAELIKKAIFDNKEVQEFGIEVLAKASIQIEGIGPDLLSDMVGNFALFNLIEYTKEQVETFNLKTMTVPLPRAYDTSNHRWVNVPKVDLPYFENGEFRLLAPRHIVRRMPILSTSEFYKGFLKYVLQDEEIARKRILSAVGQVPKVKIKEIEKEIEKEYESVSIATRKIARARPKLVEQYAANPHAFDDRRKPRKPKIDWLGYVDELKAIPPGNPSSKQYAEFLRKVFGVMYNDKLLRGQVETTSSDGIYRYDINFVNASQTAFFRAVKNQQLVNGVLIIESKNYGETDVTNKEFNQGLSYSMPEGRELVFIAMRDDVTQEDINRSKSIFLRHRVVVLPISDKDVIKMLEMRHISENEFDEHLIPRLQEILTT